MKSLEEIIQYLVEYKESLDRRPTASPETVKVEYQDTSLDYHSHLLSVGYTDTPEGIGFSVCHDTAPSGLTKTVVSMFGVDKSHKLQSLRITVGGTIILEYRGRWVLQHGALICAEKVADGYWGSFPRSTKYPQWWVDKVAAYKTNPTKVGPFVLSSIDIDGNAPGADFGVAAYSDQWFQFPAGLRLMHTVAMETAQRSRVFHNNSHHPDGYWMTYDKPVGFQVDTSWWREFPIYHKYKTYDDQHSSRGWRAAAVLAEAGDSFGIFVLQWWYARMAAQWYDPTRKPMDNHLLMNIEQVIQATVIHEGSRALGRAACWAAKLALRAFEHGLDRHGLANKFRLAFTKAASPISGEVSWNRGDDGYSTEEREAFEPKAPIGKMHEVGIYRAMAVEYGLNTTKVDKLLRFPRGGIKEFAKPNWYGPVYPYLELAVGDFRNYEDFGLACSTRSVLGSDQPLLATPINEYPSL
jgi:hypothetical protein